MSAHSYLNVAGHLFYAAREGYVPELAALFAEAELTASGRTHCYVSNGRALLDRLQLHGITATRARDELDSAVETWHESHPNPNADAIGVPLRDSGSLLDELATFLNSEDEWASYVEPEEVFWNLDPRTILRLALDQLQNPGVRVS